ncbi:MAG: chemotaxis protein CheB [Dehalococcoidia bacterium]
MAATREIFESAPSQGAPFGVVALVASAGGLNALTRVLAPLPANFPVPVVVLQHLSPKHRSYMADILGRRSQLCIRQAGDGDCLEAGVVFTAPPNHHMLIRPGGVLALTSTERVHFVRPSADVLLESIAQVFGRRAVAVVLSGAGSDGAAGVRMIKQSGGTVIVQDEATSEFFGMPGAAIGMGVVDFILPLEEIAPALVMLAMHGETA